MDRTPIFRLVTVCALLASGALLSSCGRENPAPGAYRDRGHPVLLVVAPDGDPDALAWEAILHERFGGCDLLDVGSWTPREDDAAREIAVFTSSALAGMDSLAAEALVPELERGLVAVLDRPTEHWGRRAGLRNLGTAPLPSGGTRHQWSVESGEEIGPGSPSSATAGLSAGKLETRGLQYLVLRPGEHGVRNVGTPLGVPVVWWKAVGAGGWLSQGLPLPELYRGIEASGTTDGSRRRASESLLVESCFTADVFPHPFPRIWTLPTPGSPGDEGSVHDEARPGEVLWHFERKPGGRVVVEIRNGSPESELAVPVEWHGQVLADWTAEWKGAASRKVRGPRGEWRLIRLSGGDLQLDLRYRPSPGAARWN